MNRERMNELVGKLESITNGGLNELTQDDYGDLYTFLLVSYDGGDEWWAEKAERLRALSAEKEIK